MTDQRIFQLEKQLLESLSENRENQSGNEISPLIVAAIEKKSNEEGLFCNSCLVSADDREHFKTDFHRFNTKRRIKGLDPLSEDQFDELEELSSIEASSDDDDDDDEIQKSKAGSPFIPFHVGQTNTELLVYKQVLFNSKAKDEDYLKQLHGIQIGNSKVSWTLIMLSSGHFSAAIVDLRTLKVCLESDVFKHFSLLFTKPFIGIQQEESKEGHKVKMINLRGKPILQVPFLSCPLFQRCGNSKIQRASTSGGNSTIDSRMERFHKRFHLDIYTCACHNEKHSLF